MDHLEEQWRLNHEPDLVSVIIPTYNRARVVSDAIQSALAQSWPRMQIIVVDDGSTDTTSSVLRNVEGITLIQKRNAGVASARNAGLRAATGEYIASLDSDDVWHSDFVAKVLTSMREHSLQVGIAAREQRVAGQLRPVRATPLERRFLESKEDTVVIDAVELRALTMASVLGPNPGVVLHRRVVEPWPEHLRTVDDIGQHMRVILRHSPGAIFLTKPLWEVAPKGQDLVSIVGRNDRADLGLRTAAELAIIEGESRPQLTRGERHVFSRKRADWIAGDSAYQLSLQGQILAALRAFLSALVIDRRSLRLRQLVRGIIRATWVRVRKWPWDAHLFDQARPVTPSSD